MASAYGTTCTIIEPITKITAMYNVINNFLAITITELSSRIFRVYSRGSREVCYIRFK